MDGFGASSRLGDGTCGTSIIIGSLKPENLDDCRKRFPVRNFMDQSSFDQVFEKRCLVTERAGVAAIAVRSRIEAKDTTVHGF